MQEVARQPILSELHEGAQSWREVALRGSRQLAGALALTAALGAVSATAAQTPPVGDKPAALAPHLTIGAEDDAVVASANQALINTATNQARDLGARVMRDIIYPRDVFRNRLAKYDPAVRSEIHKGFYVTLTLACNQEHWTDQKVYRYVTAAVKHFDALKVHEYSICNEGNLEPWLRPKPHETLAQTYSDLYSVGYRAVGQQAGKDGVDDRVVSFEVSSEARPLQFMRQVLNYAPMKTDAVAYHPYTLTASPFERCDLKGDVGFACLPVIEKLIQSEYDAGRLETPDGQKPGLYLSEFAYKIRNPHSTSTSRTVSDKARAVDYRRDLKIACDDPNVQRLGFYQILPHAKGTWHSQLFTARGEPLRSARVIQDFADSHTCVR